MTWQAASFEQMPKFADAVSIPAGANYSAALNTISALQTAIADKTIDVIEWNGSFDANARVEVNASHTNTGQRRYITGTGDFPPIRFLGGAVGQGWTVINMTFSSQEPSDAYARIDLVNTKDFMLTNCSRSWPGAKSFIVAANTRNESCKNLTIQRNQFTGTQSSAREFMAFIYASWVSNIYGNDYWSNGEQSWAANSDNIRFLDNQCHNIGDSVQFQSEIDGTENRHRHYTVVDHRNAEIAGNLCTSDAGLAENGFDFKAASQTYANRLKIHHNILSGFKSSSGGGASAIGEAIVIHFNLQYVEIADNIIHDVGIGINAKSVAGQIDILRNRISNCELSAFNGERDFPDVNPTPYAVDINVIDCLIDDATKLMDNETAGSLDTNWSFTNTVFRNIPSAGSSQGLSGSGNYFSGSTLGGIAGATNVSMPDNGSVAIPGFTLPTFGGIPDTHPWAFDGPDTGVQNLLKGFSPPIFSPPFVGYFPVKVNYTGASPFYRITASIESGDVKSRVVSLVGDWIADEDFAASMVPADRDYVWIAVWVWGTEHAITKVRIDFDDLAGEIASTVVDVEVAVDSRTFELTPNNVIVNGQAELEALIAAGGTSEQIYLKGGFYQSLSTIINNVPKMQTHPADWFAGLPAVFQGTLPHSPGNNNHRLWATLADNIELHRLFFFQSSWTGIHIQDVDAPHVSNIIQWELYTNSTLDHVTNADVHDVHTVGAWDAAGGGENANGLVMSGCAVGSNNHLYRCIGLGIADDFIDGWESHDLSIDHVVAAFIGKGQNGDGVGTKFLGGNTGSGGGTIHTAYYYDCKFGLVPNESTPDAPSTYHNITAIASRDRGLFFDGSVNANANVFNCYSENNNNNKSLGAYNGSNNSWQLGIELDVNKFFGAAHLSWEGFEASGFGQLQTGSVGVDAGTNTGINPSREIINNTVDIGADEFGLARFTQPDPPEGLTVDDTVGKWTEIQAGTYTQLQNVGGKYWQIGTAQAGKTGNAYLIALPFYDDSASPEQGGHARFFGTVQGNGRLWVRGQADDDAHNEIYVGHSDNPVNALPVIIGSNAGPSDWTWSDTDIVLPQGGAIINLYTKKGGTRVDKFLITDGGAIPSGSEGLVGGTVYDFSSIGGGSYPPDIYGHYFYINGSGDQASQQAGAISKLDNYINNYPWDPIEKTGVRGALRKLRWDWTASGSEDAHIQQLLTTAADNGMYLVFYYVDINFGLDTNTAVPTASFCPSDIENNNGTVVSGNVTNLAACGKLWQAWVMDRFIGDIIKLHNLCKGYESYLGIMLPETTRSEFNGGDLTNPNDFINVDEAMYVQYSRMLTELKASMPDHFINGQFNYLGDKLNTIVDDADELDGVMIGTPDSIRFWDPKNPNHGNKLAPIYNIVRLKKSEMIIGMSVETRDMPNNADSTWDMFFNIGDDSLRPHLIFWYGYHPDLLDDWEGIVLDKLIADNWRINRSAPADIVRNAGSAGLIASVEAGPDIATEVNADVEAKFYIDPGSASSTSTSITVAGTIAKGQANYNTDNIPYVLTQQLTATQPGTYTITAVTRFDDDPETELTATLTLTVSAGNEVFPQGVNQYIGEDLTVVAGNSIIIPATLSNQFDFSINRLWTVDDTSLATLIRPNDNLAELSCVNPGTVLLTSTLSSPGISTTLSAAITINIIAAPSGNDPPGIQSITPDGAASLGADLLLYSYAIDPDGEDVLYAWEYVSGPINNVEIANPFASDTTVRGLTALGTYQFHLQVLSGGEVVDGYVNISVLNIGTKTGGVTVASLTIIL